MKSPLEVTYREICANPLICKDNPLSKRRDLQGVQVLWEGRQNEKDLQSPIFKVCLDRYDFLIFFRYKKREGQWVQIDRLEPIRFFNRKSEHIPPGVVRIELFANGRMTRKQG